MSPIFSKSVPSLSSVLSRSGRALAQCQAGGTMMIFALLTVPVVGMVGFSIDMVRTSNAKSALRATLDATLLSAAKAGEDDFLTAANAYFDSNLNELSKLEPSARFSTSKTSAGTVYKGTATAEVGTTFASVLGINSIPLSMTASVTEPREIGDTCIWVLDESANHALTFNSEAKVVAPDCAVQVNSMNNAAAVFNSNIDIYFSDICIAGPGVTNNYGPIDNLRTSCEPKQEPFTASMPAVAPGDCDYGSKNFNGGNVTLHPGTYCGGINFNNNTNVTFLPGLYVLNGSKWNVNGGEWDGEGVSFYFHTRSSGIQFNSAVTSVLTPPASGPYQDIMFFEAPGLAKSNFIFNDSEDFQIEGLVYLPSRDTTYNANSIWRAREFTFVVNTLKLNQTNWDLTPGVESKANWGDDTGELRISS